MRSVIGDPAIANRSEIARARAALSARDEQYKPDSDDCSAKPQSKLKPHV
jgi:hypothetical protein